MKFLSIIFRVTAIICAISTVILYFVIGDTKKQLEIEKNNAVAAEIEADRESEQANRKVTSLDKLVESLRSDILSEKGKSAKYYQQIKQFRTELSELNKSLSDSNKDIDLKIEEINNLKKELISVKTAPQLDNNSSKIADCELQIEELKAEIESLREENESYIAGLSSKTNRNQSDEFNSNRNNHDTSLNIGKVIKGKVLEVDDKYKIVAISLGASQDAIVDMELLVKKDNVKLAKLVITNVKNDFSVAQLVFDFGQPFKLKNGDDVTFIIQ